MNDKTLTVAIKAQALQLGFDVVGVAKAGKVNPPERLLRWLEAGYHGSMSYLSRQSEWRLNPTLYLPYTRSIIVVAQNYFHPASGPGTNLISRYAWGDDYHKVLGKKLQKLARFIHSLAPDSENRYFVDSGTVMEKYWAVQAGVGWQGKHSLIISPPYGSWVFLGVMLTTVELMEYLPASDRCGSCRRCIDACPTKAIVQPYVLDARRCISYNTIELPPDREISEDIAEKLNGKIFGCDICQQVCPFNYTPIITNEPAFTPRPDLLQMTRDDFNTLDELTFNNLFHHNTLRRCKYARLRRNLRAGETS